MNSGFSCKLETLAQCCPLVLTKLHRQSSSPTPSNSPLPPHPSPYKRKTGLPPDFPFQVDGAGRHCAQVWKIRAACPASAADWLGPALVWRDTQAAPPRAELRRVNALGVCGLAPKQPPLDHTQELLPKFQESPRQQRGLAQHPTHGWGQGVEARSVDGAHGSLELLVKAPTAGPHAEGNPTQSGLAD